MTLRTQIETAIRTSPDSGQAAIAVCRLLEDEIGLVGNGWLDDDDELLALLSATEPKITSAGPLGSVCASCRVGPQKPPARCGQKRVPSESHARARRVCEADLEAILNLDNVPAAELATLRKLVHVRARNSQPVEQRKEPATHD